MAAIRRALYMGAAAAFLAGCGLHATPVTMQNADANLGTNRLARGAFNAPILIAADLANDTFEYWPIHRHGDKKPRYLSGGLIPGPVNGLAADGNRIALAVSTSPNGVVLLYDVVTHARRLLSDPYGTPINVAIDRKRNIYALNAYGSVTVYKHGSWQASVRRCAGIYEASAIGLDNEGDLFVSGLADRTSHRFSWKILEYPAGSRTCHSPSLGAHGHVRGIGADPKTDDLVVIVHSDAGDEMIVYPKPYDPRTARRHPLHAVTMAGDFRLSANSEHIFYRDALLIGYTYYPIVDQAAYPSGRFEGYYQNGEYGTTGYIGGFTTIPNALPN